MTEPRVLRSPTLQRRTASALNSALNDLRVRAMCEHSYRTGVRFLVSTETGEDHAPSPAFRESGRLVRESVLTF